MDIILITNTISNPEKIISWFSWCDSNIPALFHYQTIIVEIPNEIPKDCTLLEEIKSANELGSTVIWLMTQDSNPILAEEVLGGKIAKIREGLRNTPYTIDKHLCNHRRLSWLDNYHFFFKLDESWISLAHIGSPMLSILSYKQINNNGLEIIMSGPHLINYENIDELNFYIIALKKRTLDRKSNRFSLVKLTIIIILLTCLITILRYHQIALNNSNQFTANSNVIDSFFDNLQCYILSDYYYSNIPVSALFSKAWKTEESTEYGHYLQMYLLSGHFAQEQQLVKHILKEKKQDTEAICQLYYYLSNDLLPEACKSVVDGRYEYARFLAQRYLNITEELPPCYYFMSNTNELNKARKIVKFIRLKRNNFLYKNQDTIMAAYSVINNDYDFDEVIEKLNLVTSDNAVDTEIKYYKSVAEANNKIWKDQEQYWEEFEKKYPNSIFDEEVRFNIINARLERYRDFENDDKAMMSLNRKTLDMCMSFTEQFPKSYLSDDSLKYAIKLSFSLGDKRQIWKAFTRLRNNYPNSDSYKWIFYQLKSFICNNRDLQSIESVLMALIEHAPAEEPYSTFGYFIKHLAQNSGEEENVVHSVIQVFNQYSVDSIKKLTVKDFIVTILQKWLRETNEGGKEYYL